MPANPIAIWTAMVREWCGDRFDKVYEPLGADRQWVSRCFKELDKDEEVFRHCITRYLGAPKLKRPMGVKLWWGLAILRIEDGEYDEEYNYG